MGYSKLQWFFFVVVIPFIFALIVYGVIMTFMGKSVVDQVKSVGSHVPFVSSLLDEEDKAKPSNKDKLEDEIERLTANINEQEQMVLELENKLLEKDDELIDAKETILKLEKQLENADEGEEPGSSSVKETAQMLLSMSPKDAASIISEMQNNEVIPVLQEMKASDSGRIVAKLEPARASNLMKELLSEN